MFRKYAGDMPDQQNSQSLLLPAGRIIMSIVLKKIGSFVTDLLRLFMKTIFFCAVYILCSITACIILFVVVYSIYIIFFR